MRENVCVYVCMCVEGERERKRARKKDREGEEEGEGDGERKRLLHSGFIFRKRATNYRALLRKMTCEDKASYDSTARRIVKKSLVIHTHTHACVCVCVCERKRERKREHEKSHLILSLSVFCFQKHCDLRRRKPPKTGFLRRRTRKSLVGHAYKCVYVKE